jgi:Tol biopolymer transport system component
MPIADVVESGIAMAKALAHSHRRGIIHRDIKTQNLMLTEEGDVKITDFGLAKMIGEIGVTRQGMVAGTTAYMSPEQTRGETLDHRTDIFSLGVVLFELTTGHLPFQAEHAAAISYLVVHENPVPPSSVRTDLPPSLNRIILRCLEKDRQKRIQSADEVVSELRTVQRELSGSSSWFPRLPSTLRQLTFAEAVEEHPEWSPDGTRIAFSRNINGYKKLYVKNLSDGREIQLTRGSVDDIQPTWSTDGKSILFVRSHQQNGKLEPRDIFSLYDGGDVWSHQLETGRETLLVRDAFNPSFSPDGVWVAVDASWAGPRRIWMVDNRGRNPRQVTSDVSEAVVHVNPKWSPDGTRIVFQNVERVKFDIRIVDINSGKMDWVTDDMAQDLYPVWGSTGADILLSSFRSGGLNIWRVPVSRTSSSGRAQQLTVGAGQDLQVAVSPDGKRLAYANLRLNADIWRLPVSPLTGTPTGSPEPLIIGTREESRGAWSPDGTAIAFNSDREGDMNIWLYSLEDGSVRQLTRGTGGDFQPNWSSDGRSVSFFSARSGKADLWTAAVATGELRQITSDGSLNINPFFSPDGDYLAYHSDEAGRLEPWVISVDGTRRWKLAEKEVAGHFMRWSEDGRSVVFRSPALPMPGLWRAATDGSELAFVCTPKGGAHISFSPDHSLVMDVVDHKELWVTPTDGTRPWFVFKFDDPEIRIDYPVWSPDGGWVLFDRVRPQGGNIWIMEGLE